MLCETLPTFNKITHVIYDLDGLLLATETLHEQVNQEIAQRYGKTCASWMKTKIAGRSTLESAQLLVELLELPLTSEEFIVQRNALIYPLYPQAEPLPGAIRLTQHLYQARIPQAIATSSSSHHVALKMANYQDWLAIFDFIIMGDDPALERSKPAPDIFLLAAQQLQAQPQHCLVFEDSLAGMEAALAAGMSVVVIPDPSLDQQLYQRAQQILPSLEKFEPQLWHLPAFPLLC